MQDCIKCIFCQLDVPYPRSDKKDRRNGGISSCICGAQYSWYSKKLQWFPQFVNKRMKIWNMSYNFGRDKTRYVRFRNNKVKTIEEKMIPREEYNLDGLILPDRFLELKMFI